MLAQGLLRAVRDGALDHLAEHRIAEALLEERERHAAGTKARYADLRRELGEPVVDLAFDILGGKDDLEFVLQAFGRRLRYFHHDPESCFPTSWCGRRDLNPHDLTVTRT